MERADFLLEIGTEEIPAGYIPPALAELARKVEEFFADNAISVDGRTETFATPRRLTVRVRGVALVQETRTQERLGPAVKAAYDQDGKPTKAAEGFARSVGRSVDELERIETDKGERLGATVTVGGATTRDLLLNDDVALGWMQLGFPKTMRWIEGSDFRFARPIRWMVCLLGEEVVPLSAAALTAGRVSSGHRTLAPGPVEIQSPQSYEEDLRAAHVEPDPAVRRERIEEGARRLAAESGGTVHDAPDLLDELVFLSEHPHPVLGSFSPDIVETLPAEVIITAMRSHQRYFSVAGPDKLLPHFITFRDGGDRGLDNVVEGNERVLRARLDDARFYWDEDRALSSDAKVEVLDRIVWLEDYGSLGDKCRRIATLATSLAAPLGIPVPEHLERAALLCKSDLATEMIKDGKEFTKLQGIIGRYYALEAGEPVEVADAIADHQHPKSAGDRLPNTDRSRLIALADRIDSIAGCVLAGFTPTGSQDPYALRRQAFAVLRLLKENEWRLDLLAAMRGAVEAFDPADEAVDPALDAIAALFWGRLETQLAELPVEIVRAVLSVSVLDPFENSRAATALARFQGDASFAMLLEGAKRCRNILVKEDRLTEESAEDQARSAALRAEAARRWDRWRAHVGQGDAMGFREDGFEEPAETTLYQAVREAIPNLEKALTEGDHGGAYGSLAGLGSSISAYFDAVLVNAKDPEVRQNRLSFLEDIHYLFARFADLSRVPTA